MVFSGVYTSPLNCSGLSSTIFIHWFLVNKDSLLCCYSSSWSGLRKIGLWLTKAPVVGTVVPLSLMAIARPVPRPNLAWWFHVVAGEGARVCWEADTGWRKCARKRINCSCFVVTIGVGIRFIHRFWTGGGWNLVPLTPSLQAVKVYFLVNVFRIATLVPNVFPTVQNQNEFTLLWHS